MLFKIVNEQILCKTILLTFILELYKLKSLYPIDCKFHGHDENDGFVLYEYIILNYAVVSANIQTSTL